MLITKMIHLKHDIISSLGLKNPQCRSKYVADIYDFMNNMNICSMTELNQLTTAEIVSKWHMYTKDKVWSYREFSDRCRGISKLCAIDNLQLLQTKQHPLRHKVSTTKGAELFVRNMKHKKNLTEAQRNLWLKLTKTALCVNKDHQIRKSTLRSLLYLVSFFTDENDFTNLSGPEIESRITRNPQRFSAKLLIRLRMHHSFDNSKLFQSHLYGVPGWLLQEQPNLKLFPPNLSRALLRYVPLAVDRAWLVTLATRLLNARSQKKHRESWRTARGIACSISWLVIPGIVEAAREEKWGYSVEYMMRNGISCKDDFVRVLARIRCATLKLSKLHRTMHMRDGDQQQSQELRLCSFFNGAINHELFVPVIERAFRVGEHHIWIHMEQLNQENPDRWPLVAKTTTTHVPNPEITSDDVSKLLSLDVSTRGKVLLYILYTTALRHDAIANMKIEDVWDTASQTVKSLWYIREKFSKIRIISPCPELSDTMSQYIRTEYRDFFAYLLSSPKAPLTKPSGLRHLLRGMCSRAGVPQFNPHQFRAYMVQMFITNGNSLEAASKYLGHCSVQTTYKSYFRVDNTRANIPFFRNEGDVHSERTDTDIIAWEEEQQLRKMLESELELCRKELRNAQRELLTLRRQPDSHEGDMHVTSFDDLFLS